MNNQFTTARVRLTIYYTLILISITASLSLVFYQRSSQIFDREYHRLQRQVMRDFQPDSVVPMRGPLHQIDPTQIVTVKHQLALSLVSINSIIALIGILASYLLAGYTLKPIQKNVIKQEQFISDSSHELKTPLTALKTSIEVQLLDQKLSKHTQKLLAQNLREIDSLILLTQNLLQLMDHQPIHKEWSDITHLIQETIKQMQPLASKKQQQINYQGPKRVQVKFQKDLLQQCLRIFIDNAVKYSPPKTEISLKLQTSRSKIQIRISDHGQGIPASDLAHIFERFYQVDKARTRSDNQGHGLGLAIAEQIIKAHRGKISVHSVENQGTTFTITLPKS